MSRWFRHYAGMMRDEKLVSAAVKSKQPVERVVWVWGAILESASEINENGRYDFDTGEAAYFLRCDDTDLVGILACLESLGRLSGGVVVRWGDRQYSSDTAAERQRRYRERKSANATVPADDRNDKRDSDVTVTSRDGAVTPQETDTELDTDNRKEEPTGSSKKRGCRLPADFIPDQPWAISEGLSPSQAQTEAAKFRDYWNGKAGASASKLDWPGTWRNWVRSAVERLPSARGSPGRQPANGSHHFTQLAEDMTDEPERTFGSDQGNRHDARGVPILTISDYRRHG